MAIVKAISKIINFFFLLWAGFEEKDGKKIISFTFRRICQFTIIFNNGDNGTLPFLFHYEQKWKLISSLVSVITTILVRKVKKYFVYNYQKRMNFL